MLTLVLCLIFVPVELLAHSITPPCILYHICPYKSTEKGGITPKVYIVFSCVYADKNDALARVSGLEDAYMVECTVQ